MYLLDQVKDDFVKSYKINWILWLFFVSGFAGLVYEVVYAKALGVTFGGTALASNTVLATYMGGMALGAWLGSGVAARTNQPLRLYAICELGIGLYALATPFIFEFIRYIYISLAEDRAADSEMLTALRVFLGVSVLGVPTVLMGATMPLIFKKLKMNGLESEKAIAPLYAANVLGAAVGALVGGYVLLPTLGRNGATYLAALLGLMIALYVFDRLKVEPELDLLDREVEIDSKEIFSLPIKNINNAMGGMSVLILLIGGGVTLGLEVLNMHMLSLVAGNSVYAFGLMLATFLLGLSAGSSVSAYLLKFFSKSNLMIWSQMGLAIAILASTFVWDGIPSYFASFGVADASYGINLSFAGRELIRGLVCAIAMMPAAFFIGLSYPAAMAIATDWLGKGNPTKGFGVASGINTFGNISGVLLVGFLLLPNFGSLQIYKAMFLIANFFAVAILIIGCFFECGEIDGWRGGVRWYYFVPVAFVASLLSIFPKQWDYNALSTGSNVYFKPQLWGEVIDHLESVEGGFSMVAESKNKGSDEPSLTLLTNGKFQGNNVPGGEMVAQAAFALMPLMHVNKRDSALVIGYGTGMSAHVLNLHGFQSVDIAELSRDIVVLADKYFSDINGLVSQDSNVRMHYTDGRNYLMTQTKKYSLISIEVTSIWFAGAANLYNEEFYEIAKTRLNNDGVLQQWVQLHHMQPLDLLYIIGSIRSQFKNVWLYASGGQGIIVASNSENSIDNFEAKQKLKNEKNNYSVSIDNLEKQLLLSNVDIDQIVSRLDKGQNWLKSTDKNLFLEYSTPKGNSLSNWTIEDNISMLKKLANKY